MRVRHIPNSKEALCASKIVENDATALKGKWKSFFNKTRLNIEIGCGKGGYIYQLIENNLSEAFIAIEKNSSIAYLALKKLEQLQFDHFRLLNIDAANITDVFAEEEVDCIYLNFSDPWPKKRAHKRRLSHANFLNQYAKILAKDGQIVMKTDNYDLFVYSLNSFIANGWELVSVDTDFRSSEKSDPITEYEQKFINQQVKINRLVVRRKQDETTNKTVD